MANANNSLAHTKWMCKYHIVFTSKYRRNIIFNQYKESIAKILRQLCQYKGVEIIEGHLMPDHVPHAGKHSAKIFSSTVYGISEWKECPDVIR